jgi:translation initiation factor 1
MSDDRTRLVYSTDKEVCRKEKPSERVEDTGVKPAEQRVTVRLERKGRGGKSVTVVEATEMSREEKEALLWQLKKGLGSGGTILDKGFEIQGDHRDAIMATLERAGYRPKRSG